MNKEAFEPTPSTPEQARARLVADMPMWSKLVKERGIQLD